MIQYIEIGSKAAVVLTSTYPQTKNAALEDAMGPCLPLRISWPSVGTQNAAYLKGVSHNFGGQKPEKYRRFYCAMVVSPYGISAAKFFSDTSKLRKPPKQQSHRKMLGKPLGLGPLDNQPHIQ